MNTSSTVDPQASALLASPTKPATNSEQQVAGTPPNKPDANTTAQSAGTPDYVNPQTYVFGGAPSPIIAAAGSLFSATV